MKKRERKPPLRVPFDRLEAEFRRVLLALGFAADAAVRGLSEKPEYR